jgi:multidrug resistance efflux pump
MDNDTKQDTVKKNGGNKRKNFILIIAAVLLFIGVGYWYYSYVEGQKYFVTENAKVTANLYPIIPLMTGELLRYNVRLGNMVQEDDVIGIVEPGGSLRSPIYGQVVQSNVTLNQTVNPSTPIAIIADVDNIYIGANIEETDILKIKKGQNVIVELDSYPGRKFNAYVSEVNMITPNALTGNLMSFSTSGTYTKVTQLIPIKIKINGDVRLEGIIGTNAKVRIRIK